MPFDFLKTGGTAAAGTIDGSGTATRLAKWSDADTLAASAWSETAANGTLTLNTNNTSAVTIAAGVSNNDVLRFKSGSGVTYAGLELMNSAAAQTLLIYGYDLTAASIPGNFEIYGANNNTLNLQAPILAATKRGVVMGNNARTLANALTVVQATDVTNLTGTTTANASTTITGVSSLFNINLGIGDYISLSSAASTYARITAIASNTSLTVDAALGNGTSQTINKKQCIASWQLADRTPVIEMDPAGTLSFFTNASLDSKPDVVQIGGYDLSAGNRTLAISTETAVAADAAAVSTHSLSVRINGTTYKILLKT